MFLEQDAGIIPQEAPDLDQALDDLMSRRTDAVVFDTGVVSYSVNRGYRNDLRLVEPIIGRDPYGIALPTGSRWVEKVNEAVIAIGRDGTADRLQERWFGRK